MIPLELLAPLAALAGALWATELRRHRRPSCPASCGCDACVDERLAALAREFATTDMDMADYEAKVDRILARQDGPACPGCGSRRAHSDGCEGYAGCPDCGWGGRDSELRFGPGQPIFDYDPAMPNELYVRR